MLDVNEQYSILDKSDKLELKELALLIITKKGAKYKNKSWNDYSKLTAYMIKEFCNSGRILNTSTAKLKKDISKSNADVNKILARLIENEYIEKFQKVTYEVEKNKSITKCKLSRSEYTLIPTDKLLDLIDECGFPHPDRQLICNYRNNAIKDVERITIVKSKENGIDVTTTTKTDVYGNRKRKKEVNEDQAMDRIDKLNEEVFNINLNVAYNGQELDISPVEPLIDIDSKSCK